MMNCALEKAETIWRPRGGVELEEAEHCRDVTPTRSIHMKGSDMF